MPFQGRIKTSKADHYNTPLEGWSDIMQFIPKETKIWCPFYNDGTAKKILKDLEYNNVYHENEDFFTYYLDDHICIDNPPFSIKDKIIGTLYEKKKPFSLLLPFDTLERKYLFKYQEGLQIVIPKNRYRYTANANNNPPFKSVWLCWNFQKYLGNKELIFLD